jgi:hypothetical protein
MGNCVICGRDLKNKPFWATKCSECYKRTELKGRKCIDELIKKYSKS